MQSSILINLCYFVWTHFNSAMTKLSHREWQISDMTSTTLRLWNTQTIYTRSTSCRSGKISENHPIRWVCAIYSSHTALHGLRCLSGFENTSYKRHAKPCHAMRTQYYGGSGWCFSIKHHHRHRQWMFVCVHSLILWSHRATKKNSCAPSRVGNIQRMDWISGRMNWCSRWLRYAGMVCFFFNFILYYIIQSCFFFFHIMFVDPLPSDGTVYRVR